MKRLLLFAFLITTFSAIQVKAQPVDSIDIYLLTCDTGTEVYSVYGHSALRIDIRGTKADSVYNWGLFDFDTPNFTYRFAKGNLDYLLGSCSYKRFLQEYYFEGRSVWSQKLNLSGEEKRKLIKLLNENLKPGNKSYRYDFFYDNCATRVRDIIENSLTQPVSYQNKSADASFRALIDEFQVKMPWLDFGADFLLGLQADKMASFRDQMFLPMYLKDNLSELTVNHSGKIEPLLGTPDIVLDMSGEEKDDARPMMPAVIAWLVFIFVLLVTFVLGIPALGKISDWLFLSLFSLLSLVLFFCTFFSAHEALHYNMLLIAFNPLLPFITYFIFAGKKCRKLCRIAISLAALYFPVALIVGQGIHPVTIPVVLILIIRLFKYCEFGKEDTQPQSQKERNI